MSDAQQMPALWVTGAAGLIGSHFLRHPAANAKRWRLIGLSRAELDLLDSAAVARRFNQDRPALIIHCAAMSKSPACHANPALARRINVEVTEQLAELAEDGRFVFLSTDLIFDGRRGGYAENDAPNPLHVYGETKVAAEAIVRIHPRHLVIRTSLNCGTSPTGDRAFNEELLLAVRAGKPQRLFTDEFRNPIHVTDTVRLIWALIGVAATGTYHVAGREKLSRWEIGEWLASRHPELRSRIEPTSLRTYQGPPRAPDTSLNCGKAERLLGGPMPAFRREP
jgi:dTDP-4-dehydrorhamnose reductase